MDSIRSCVILSQSGMLLMRPPDTCGHALGCGGALRGATANGQVTAATRRRAARRAFLQVPGRAAARLRGLCYSSGALGRSFLSLLPQAGNVPCQAGAARELSCF